MVLLLLCVRRRSDSTRALTPGKDWRALPGSIMDCDDP